MRLFWNSKDGDTKSLDYVVGYDDKSNLLVDFVAKHYTDNNKWGIGQVLSDVNVTRLIMPRIYSQIDRYGAKITKYVTKNMTRNFDQVINEIANLAQDRRDLSISLPTTTMPLRRGIPTMIRPAKDTFLPLIVKVDGEDVSHDFWFFDKFEDKAVNVAYDFLINGKEIETDASGLIDDTDIKGIRHRVLSTDDKEM